MFSTAAARARQQPRQRLGHAFRTHYPGRCGLRSTAAAPWARFSHPLPWLLRAAEARSTAGPGSPLTALTSARRAPCVFHRRYWETHLHHRACSQPARRLHRLRQRGEGCCLSNNHARRNSEHLVQPVHELLATDPTVVDFCIYDAPALAEEDAGDIRARPSANARQSTNARETSPTVLPFILARLALTS